MVLPALLLAAGFSHLASPPDGLTSTVYTHGENGFQCIRIPGTLAVPFGTSGDTVLLSFAAARSFAGDSCFPNGKTPNPKQYSAHVVKRSTDLGKTWGAMVELGRNAPRGDHISPEGCEIYHAESKTVTSIWQSNVVSNATTGLRLWQSQSTDAGLSWSPARPMVIPKLLAANVSAGTHIAPGNGIEIQSGQHAGRLLVVLILTSGNVLDVVVYSDDGGSTWELSETPLPHNGEAQLAEVSTGDGASTVLFDGRSKLKGYPRGLAWSADAGASFHGITFATDGSSGISCMASLLVDPVNHSTLLFSHPAGSPKGPRSHGVLLRSDDFAKSWSIVSAATPDNIDQMFAYSNLNALPGGSIGLTFETGDAGCTAAASACRISYRTFPPLT